MGSIREKMYDKRFKRLLIELTLSGKIGRSRRTDGPTHKQPVLMGL